ncbi:MAG: uroporphyrinogen decarboxylase family protein [Lentisphaeria bacterium]|jgi:hypothetical protein
MNKRNLVLDALAHRQPQALPVDFGATPVTGIHCGVVAQLREHFGLEKRPVKVGEPYQMLGMIEPDLQQALGVSVTSPYPRGTIFGFDNENWKPWRAPWGQELLVSEHFHTRTDAAGDIFIYPQGDTAAPACARMPKESYFFDTIIRQPPIDEDRLNPADNCEEFTRLSPARIAQLAADARAARKTGLAVVAGLPGTALGDIALVPAPFLKHPKGIRDIAEWYISTASRQDYIHAIFHCQTEIALENLEAINAAYGDCLDVVMLCGTDFGTQNAPFCSPDTFRSLWKPHYQRMTRWIHAHTPWKVFKHSCGAVERLIPDFIACGFDILNPVQCSAAGMAPAHLKEAYGSQITFWGAGVDTQHVLPFGTPRQVREQVLERCRLFGTGGGFVFNAIHNIQARTPIANVVALLDAVASFNHET